jgi:hypothetical protein
MIALAGGVAAAIVAAVMQQQSAPPRVSSRAPVNLLANGSFEQPAVGGLMVTIQRPLSWQQKLQLWWQINSPFNRVTWAPGRRLAYSRYVFYPMATDELPGWRITQGSVDVTTQRYWQPAPGQGSQSLDLVGTPGAATLEQTFRTEPGQEYVFSGWLAHNPENPVAPMSRANVLINDDLLVQLVHQDRRASKKNMRWHRFAYHFRASAGRTTLKLVDVTGTYPLCGTVLDGLAVAPASTASAPGR